MLQCVYKCSRWSPSARRHSLTRFIAPTLMSGFSVMLVLKMMAPAFVCACVSACVFLNGEGCLLRVLTTDFPVR